MSLRADSETEISDINFQDVEHQFSRLLHLADLDQKIDEKPALKEDFEDTLEYALSDGLDGPECEPLLIVTPYNFPGEVRVTVDQREGYIV